ncbi:MAG: helix-turn-helix domain-containing protein [Candidatus Microthrix sp.]|uniref:Helix-turn-helix domain-containing protein n=1 Tax=Candidatus Neomicrothrix subdominans TaxID=2954438 RepID=A0A936NBI8_9ACTN|nr:helix-turn-helix domain-containing protein [Candidatus Microthrix subdominans]
MQRLQRLLGLSQEEVAGMAGVSRPSLWNWQQGRTPQERSLRRLADVLGAVDLLVDAMGGEAEFDPARAQTRLGLDEPLIDVLSEASGPAVVLDHLFESSRAVAPTPSLLPSAEDLLDPEDGEIAEDQGPSSGEPAGKRRLRAVTRRTRQTVSGMIPSGIPNGRDEWPPGVLDHLRRFEQGHLVSGLPFFYFTNSAYPVFGQGRTADDDSPELVWDAEDLQYGMIATQTCDLREEDERSRSSRGSTAAPSIGWTTPNGVWIPARLVISRRAAYSTTSGCPTFPRLRASGQPTFGFCFRLRRAGCLAGNPLMVSTDETKRLVIGQRIALIHSRPAFDPALLQSVSEPLVAALRRLAEGDPDLYEEISDSVYAIGVRTDRLVEMTLDSVEIFLLCWHEPSDAGRLFWESCSEEWSQIALRSGDHRLRPLQVKMLDDTSSAELIRLQVVPSSMDTGRTPFGIWIDRCHKRCRRWS